MTEEQQRFSTIRENLDGSGALLISGYIKASGKVVVDSAIPMNFVKCGNGRGGKSYTLDSVRKFREENPM